MGKNHRKPVWKIFRRWFRHRALKQYMGLMLATAILALGIAGAEVSPHIETAETPTGPMAVVSFGASGGASNTAAGLLSNTWSPRYEL